jgi:hypothetical protein
MLRGEARGDVSLLDPNLEALHSVPGTAVVPKLDEWLWGLVQMPSLLEAA